MGKKKSNKNVESKEAEMNELLKIYKVIMSKLNNKIKVLVTMSGGVDSSVAAALLVADGYDVTGAFMVNYDDIGPQGESCWAGDYQDALRVAAKLGIPLMRLNFVKEYKKTVLDYMYEEYRKGRTPNPDVLCNKFIKFGAWLDKAKKLGFDFIATGHYARLANSPLGRGRGGLVLMEAKDKNKDQTYFLHQLNQEQLKHILFPIGDYTKPEVRKLAKKFNLPTAEKEESMGICFIGEVPMKEFLMKKIKPNPGKIITSIGEVVGEHRGIPFYTIGERIGVKLQISNDKCQIKSKYQNSKPMYVVGKDIKKNILIVGYEDDPLLYKKEIVVGARHALPVHWISGQPPKFPLKCEARLRHRQPLQKCVVYSPLVPIHEDRGSRSLREAIVGRGGLAGKFSTPQRAVTPGQFAVFYKKGECLGGGVIQ